MIRSCVFVLALFLGALQPSLQAQTIAIATGQNANQVEQLRFPTTYSVNVTSKFSYSTVWAWRQNDGDCVSGYMNGVNQNGDSKFNYGLPGEFDIQCVITYFQSSDPSLGNPPAPQTITKHVVIPKPAITKIVGAGVDTSYCTQAPPANSTTSTANSLNGQPGCWIYFILTSNGNPIGPQLNGFSVQENVTNIVSQGVSLQGPGWAPTKPGDARFFFGTPPAPNSTQVAICDFKYCQQPANGVYPTGQWQTYSQENRINWATLCGSNVVSWSLGSKNWATSGATNPPTWNTNFTP